MGIAEVGLLVRARAGRCLLQTLLTLLLVAQPAYLRAAPLFGQHLPHGAEAVAYLYGPAGTWREQTNVYFGWNFYKHCETPSHAHDAQALLRQASVANSTAPDANCILFGDFNNNGEIADETIGGFAFHEHAGRGRGGEQTSSPFYQFWFDDNWVARYVSDAYGRPHPIGLHDFNHPLRWRVVGGDNRYWRPYSESSPHIDQIALNGLYKFNARDFNGALAAWNAIRNASGATYDSVRGRYGYSFATESIYYLGLWAILSERLLAGRADFEQRSEVLQHAMSLHDTLLELQERDAQGNRLGWRTGTAERALINTETTSLAVLALGSHASWVLEPGQEPLSSAAGTSGEEHGRLSAIAGQSVPGHVVRGPYWKLAPGTYEIDFTLRSPATRIESSLATIDIYDGNAVLATKTIEGAEAPGGDQWRRYRLVADVRGGGNLTEFRVFWHGAYDLDVGPIRIIRREASAPVQMAVAARGAQSAPLSLARPERSAVKGSVRAAPWYRRIETYVKHLR